MPCGARLDRPEHPRSAAGVRRSGRGSLMGLAAWCDGDERQGGPTLSPPALGPRSQRLSLVVAACGKRGSEGSAGACEESTVRPCGRRGGRWAGCRPGIRPHPAVPGRSRARPRLLQNPRACVASGWRSHGPLWLKGAAASGQLVPPVSSADPEEAVEWGCPARPATAPWLPLNRAPLCWAPGAGRAHSGHLPRGVPKTRLGAGPRGQGARDVAQRTRRARRDPGPPAPPLLLAERVPPALIHPCVPEGLCARPHAGAPGVPGQWGIGMWWTHRPGQWGTGMWTHRPARVTVR